MRALPPGSSEDAAAAPDDVRLTRREEGALAVYGAAVAEEIRRGAPLATPALARRAVQGFAEAATDPEVGAFVCFLCAQVRPRVPSDVRHEIAWYPLREGPLRRPEDATGPPPVFLGRIQVGVDEQFALSSYLKLYGGSAAEPPDLAALPEELRPWTAVLPNPEQTAILGCPEDVVCSACPEPPARAPRRFCPRCQISLCQDCKQDLRDHPGRAPAEALTNDLWTGFPPALLYTEEVTVVELICASVCFPSMICFTLEARYRGDHLRGQKQADGEDPRSTPPTLGARRVGPFTELV